MERARENPDLRSGLNPVEAEFVRFFVHLATFLNLPRSVGELFGYLFAAESPRPFDEIVSALGISKGSASQGLKWLAQIGAITTVYVPRDRRNLLRGRNEHAQTLRQRRAGVPPARLEGNGRSSRRSRSASPPTPPATRRNTTGRASPRCGTGMKRPSSSFPFSTSSSRSPAPFFP